MLTETEILKLLLPEVLVEYFDITKIEKVENSLHINLEEKNSIPKEFTNCILQFKDFTPEIIVEDFPLRGKTVKLHIKRRRWTDTKSKQILQRDWTLIAAGTRMTHEFAEFF